MLRTRPLGRRLPALLTALLLTLLLVASARADGPGPYAGEWTPQLDGVAYHDAPAGTRIRSLMSWQEKEALTAQPAETCDDIEFTDVAEGEIILVATDADLIAESDGSRLCLYCDTGWDSYSAWTLSAGTIEEFRRTKQQLLPVLEEADIDPCEIAFWTSFEQRLRRQMALPDRYNAGKACPAEVVTHGPVGEQRRKEVEDAISISADTADRLFDWELTWPVRIHIYDNLDAYVTGVREEGGDDSASRESLEDVPGITGAPMANGGFGQVINLDAMRDPTALRRVLSHEYAHVAQAGVLGDPDMLPFFVTEGGAEYFASLVVGPEYVGLVRRFREAMSDERRNQAVPLREIVRVPGEGDDDRLIASYSRGYAAMRFLAAEWGPDSFERLHRENVGGTPERFIAALSRLTGKSLDGFESDLRRYLLSEAAKPATVGRTSFTGSSRLIDITTAHLAADRMLEIVDRFTRSHSSVRVLFGWECLSAPLRGEVRVIGPDGRPFASFSGTSGPGCDEGAGITLPLDQPIEGRAPRALPGTWTAEIYADGLLQGSITFVVE